jgi:hypothetical protein
MHGLSRHISQLHSDASRLIRLEDRLTVSMRLTERLQKAENDLYSCLAHRSVTPIQVPAAALLHESAKQQLRWDLLSAEPARATLNFWLQKEIGEVRSASNTDFWQFYQNLFRWTSTRPRSKRQYSRVTVTSSWTLPLYFGEIAERARATTGSIALKRSATLVTIRASLATSNWTQPTVPVTALSSRELRWLWRDIIDQLGSSSQDVTAEEFLWTFADALSSTVIQALTRPSYSAATHNKEQTSDRTRARLRAFTFRTGNPPPYVTPVLVIERQSAVVTRFLFEGRRYDKIRRAARTRGSSHNDCARGPLSRGSRGVLGYQSASGLSQLAGCQRDRRGEAVGRRSYPLCYLRGGKVACHVRMASGIRSRRHRARTTLGAS